MRGNHTLLNIETLGLKIKNGNGKLVKDVACGEI